MSFPLDHLVFTPDDVDLSRSPLAGQIDAETYVLGAFNPGMTRRKEIFSQLTLRESEMWEISGSDFLEGAKSIWLIYLGSPFYFC